MNECVVEEWKEKQGERTFRVLVDNDPIDPRENDNLGKMVCFHKRYNLGDKSDLNSKDFGNWDELEKHLKREEEAVVVLSLYLYDHSGLRIKVGSFAGLLPEGHARFDSGQIGFIYTTREMIKRDGLSNKKPKDLLNILSVLMEEVRIYDLYLSGQAYGYTITKKIKCSECGHEEEEILDSCWGFMGSNHKESGLYEQSGIDLDKFEMC